MADQITTAVDIQVKATDQNGSIKSIKTEIREAQQNAIAFAREFGEGSTQAAEAAKQVALLKDQMQDLGKRVEAFNPDRFERIAKLTSGLSQGFVAAQGAMALFGSKSKDLEEQMIRLQGAIALSQGLQGLKDLRDQFVSMGAAAVKAFQGVRGALLASGIGALVVLLGTVVAYWDDIKGAISGVSAEQKKLNEQSQANLKIEQDKLAAINSQDNVLKLQGKSEKEILEIKLKQVDATIAADEVVINTLENQVKLQTEAAERNNEYTKTVLKLLEAPIYVLLKYVDIIGEALGKNFDLANKFINSQANFIFDPEKVKEDGEKSIEAAKTELTKLKDQRAKFVLDIRAIDTKAANDKAAADAKAADEAFKNDIDAIKNQYDVENKLAENDKKDKEGQAAYLAQIEKDKAALHKQIQDQTKANADKARDNELKAEKQFQDLRFQAVVGGLQDIIDISKAFQGYSEQSQKRAFEIQKAASIASTIISTFGAAQKAYASQFEPPLPDSPIRAAIAAGIAIASGIARLAVISNTKFDTSSVPSAPSLSSGGGVPAPQLNQTVQQQRSITGNLTGTSGTLEQTSGGKVYVLETDITKSQQRINEIKRRAVIQ